MRKLIIVVIAASGLPATLATAARPAPAIGLEAISRR